MTDVVDAPSAKTGAGALRNVPFAVTNPERIPVQRYYDPELFELERKYFWPKVWQMACRLEEIPEVGDWVEYQILDQSVFVVRTRQGVKAFHNACRHRGVKLLSGDGNCAANGITCPFHGWRWNMDGQNTFVFFPQVFSGENLRAPDLNLVPCRVETWGGSAFINFDDDAAPLLDCIKPFAEMHDSRRPQDMSIDWWVAAEIPANWKLAMDAFMEDYHLMGSHPQFHAVLMPEADNFRTPQAKAASLRAYGTPKAYLDAWFACMDVLYDGMRSLVTPVEIEVARQIRDAVVLPDDMTAVPGEWYRQLNDAVTLEAHARGVAIPDLNSLPLIGEVNFCFPNVYLLPAFGNMAAYRFRPLTLETCLFEVWGMSMRPEGEKAPRPKAPTRLAHDDPSLPLIPSQDCINVARQQQGLRSKGFEFMRLARDVEGSISQFHRLLDGFLAGVDQDKLLKGMQIVSRPLDAPIMDIGFANPSSLG